MKKNLYTITAALPYANGPLHIGHIAGAYLPADIYARYRRLKGDEILFICGSDEHGVPITIKAKNEGISPQLVVDKYHTLMERAFREFGISFDIYSRTSKPLHHKTAQEIFKTIYEKGGFIEQVTEQYFDQEVNQFLADRYIEGTCPKCGNEKAYGDQCEKCGTSLSPIDLINPKSKLSGSPPILKETKNWFLPLDKYEKEMWDFIVTKHQNDWKANVIGQCKSWLNQGLQPRAMTRDLDWGVKVPIDNSEGKVLYVWFDAPIGYISATKDYFNNLPNSTGNEWERFWKKQDNPENNSKLIHFIGKDNIVFHCIIFPITLLAEGSYILPENIPANEFLNLEGDKISTSRNWAVWLHEYLEDFPQKEDELRYVLTSIAPETKDSEFTWKDYQARINNELVSILGNFVNRVMVLTHKYYNGKVPNSGNWNEADFNLLNQLNAYYKEIELLIESYKFRDAQNILMDVCRLGNKYLTENEPWKTINSDPERTSTVLNVSLQFTFWLGSLMEPFLPNSQKKINDLLNGPSNKIYNGDFLYTPLPVGHSLKPSKILFQPISDEAIQEQLAKLEKLKITPTITIENQKPEISYEDFTKLDLRIGSILAAEKVPNTEKLLKLTVDLGFEKRTIVSGIANFHNPTEIIGQQVIVVVNLSPRKIKGIESKGMILMAEDENKILHFTNSNNLAKPGDIIS
ncbi:MAG: methionine--tRNA ligase [Bacteroidia bacterium]|nr:methionine--tRNA ligase [Bacteroidia bacterium]